MEGDIGKYARTHTHIHVHTHTHTQTRIHPHLIMEGDVGKYTRTHTHIHAHTHAHANTHTPTPHHGGTYRQVLAGRDPESAVTVRHDSFNNQLHDMTHSILNGRDLAVTVRHDSFNDNN